MMFTIILIAAITNCVTITYREAKSIPHWTDNIVAQYIIDENVSRGRCPLGIYFYPDPDMPDHNAVIVEFDNKSDLWRMKNHVPNL